MDNHRLLDGGNVLVLTAAVGAVNKARKLIGGVALGLRRQRHVNTCDCAHRTIDDPRICCGRRRVRKGERRIVYGVGDINSRKKGAARERVVVYGPTANG
jgi:hypothetical protein